MMISRRSRESGFIAQDLQPRRCCSPFRRPFPLDREYAPLAQLDRASVYGCDLSTFDSRIL